MKILMTQRAARPWKPLENAQHSHYNNVAEHYTNNRTLSSVRRLNDYLDAQIQETLTNVDLQPPILLLGCGNHVPLFLTLRYQSVVALDISSKMLSLLNSSSKSVSRIQASAFDLPFLDNAFSLVLARGSLHHLHALEQALFEVARTLNTSGLLVFLEPFDDSTLWRTIRRQFYIRSSLLDPTSEQPLYIPKTNTCLTSLGLTPARFQSPGLFTYLLLRNSDISPLARLLSQPLIFRFIFPICLFIDSLLRPFSRQFPFYFPELIGTSQKHH